MSRRLLPDTHNLQVLVHDDGILPIELDQPREPFQRDAFQILRLLQFDP